MTKVLVTAVGLLPLAVAGIGIEELMLGAYEGKQNYDLRSFENPAWLYAGAPPPIIVVDSSSSLSFQSSLPLFMLSA